MVVRRFGPVAVLATVVALLAPACGNDGSNEESDPNKPVTLEWWHVQNTEPSRGIWQQTADAYTRAHPNVKIKITAQLDADLKPKLESRLQAGDPPDIFQTWGGGVLKQQVEAGMVKDITDDVAPWIATLNPAAVKVDQVDGKQYGIPYDYGMVGFWYNKELFTRAGVTTPPATWAQFLDAVRKIKATGVTPIALGGKDKWPGMFWWAYLALRIGGQGALDKAAEDGSFDAPPFVEAGAKLKELVDLAPFQQGFLGADYSSATGQAGQMAGGRAAMELMGHWSKGTHASVSKDKKGLGDKLGWFPFPTVDGGAGQPTEVFGGVNGFAVGKDAPPAAVDFLKFISSQEQARNILKNGQFIPVTKGAEAALTDPHTKLIAETLNKASGVQIYLDQAYAPAVGAAVNDAVQALLAGRSSPEQVASTITKTAKSQ
jgi:raffinose/stachyose/melibiose transport system substrate-binding protein